MTLHDILRFAHQKQASDIHLASQEPVALRLHGNISRLNTPALSDEAIWQFISDITTPAQQDALREQRQLDFSFGVAGIARFRVNVFYQERGISAVFRLIPNQIPSLDELGMPSTLVDICDKKQGLVLVTGATGSGKSTTLSAMIDHINRTKPAHILTIEDPIEFIHTPKQAWINQRQLHRDTLDFNQALKSALREDPDVILIGELRDLPSIRLALSAAETGHLVFATLHTNSAAKTCDRIVDVFDAAEKQLIRTMLSESLQAVICQTLIPKVGGGRVAACEIMVATHAVRNLIRENQVGQLYSAMQTGAKDGMMTLDAHLHQLYTARLIDQTTFAQYAKDPNNLSSFG